VVAVVEKQLSQLDLLVTMVVLEEGVEQMLRLRIVPVVLDYKHQYPGLPDMEATAGLRDHRSPVVAVEPEVLDLKESLEQT
jgi:hypothetical protein